ncbi:MAG: hypothetical protein ACKOBG_02080 [Actinomycetota bacterium]
MTTAAPARSTRRSPAAADLLAVALVAVVVALPLRGLFRAPGPPMEEGFMLVFPELVLGGKVPNRDFLHLYGPGSLWALAGTFRVFGTHLWTERAFGLAQQLAIIGGIFALARPWGRTLAVGCAVTAAVVIMPFGLTALAWVGAVGLAVSGLAVAMRGRATATERQADRCALLAGLLLGLAVLFRLDLVVAVGLAGVSLAWDLPPTRRRRLVGGFTLGVAPYAIHLLTAGIEPAVRGMVLEPVFRLRPGRSLPVPPSWSELDGFLQRAGALQQLDWPLPAPSDSQQLVLWFFGLLGLVGFLLATALVAVRADRRGLRPRTLLAVALLSLGMLPQALQRVDSAHLAWVGCVPMAFLPIAIYETVRRRSRPRAARPVAIGAVLVTLALVIGIVPAYTVTRYADYSVQTFGRHSSSFVIENAGRRFYYGKADRAQAAQMVIDATMEIARPGQRLVVGPADLRRTPYSDAYLYHLLPSLEPGTRYIEMDPGVADRADSGLDREIAAADLVILSSIWDDWSEPNASVDRGSDRAARVLDRDFCPVGSYLRLYALYRKCPVGTG